MSLRSIVFDFDGVLVDSAELAWQLFQPVGTKYGLPVATKEQFIALFQDNFYESFSQLLSDEGIVSQALAEFKHLLKTRYQPKFFPGIPKIVRALAQQYFLGIISSNLSATIYSLLRDAGLEDIFSCILGAEEGQRKSICLTQFLSARCCSAGEVVLVTDTVGDIREAQEVGVRTIAVTWGFHTEALLRDDRPDTIVRTPQALLEALTELEKSLPL